MDGKEEFIGAPHGNTKILKGDKIVCYGPDEAIRNLSRRMMGRAGDRQHEKAIKKEKTRKEEQDRRIEEMEKEKAGITE